MTVSVLADVSCFYWTTDYTSIFCFKIFSGVTVAVLHFWTMTVSVLVYVYFGRLCCLSDTQTPPYYLVSSNRLVGLDCLGCRLFIVL